MKNKLIFCAIYLTFISAAIAQPLELPKVNVDASQFILTSSNFKNGGKLSKANEFDGFSSCSKALSGTLVSCSSSGPKYVAEGLNCNGRNVAPAFAWQGAPASAKSFAFTIFNPDIKTGSGWWHFVGYDIPNFATSFSPSALPNGAAAINNDSGTKYFMGPCPAAGSGPNHYIFTVYALDVAKLDIAPMASAAMASFLINKHKIASATMVGFYDRP